MKKVIPISIILIVAIIFYLFSIKSGLFSERKFDPAIWSSAENGKTDMEQAELDSECIRGSMVEDLKENYLKINVSTKEDITQLLGKPSLINNECIEYNLGMCSGFKMDYDSMKLCFDNKDILNSVVAKQN